MYLNAYVPGLQSPEGTAWFFKSHRGQTFASSALMDPISKAFVAAIEQYALAEQVPLIIRENLDVGRPDQVQLIFHRRVTRKTPGRFRTRVITQGAIPSLHVDYKSSRIKEYFKEGRALRVETTINDTRAFRIGKRLKNLPALRKIGFEANRRLLDVQRISHDCSIGEDAWNQVVRPTIVGNQRASALRFDDPRVQALLSVLVMYLMQTDGFTRNKIKVSKTGRNQ